jgi:hypothetical protein
MSDGSALTTIESRSIIRVFASRVAPDGAHPGQLPLRLRPLDSPGIASLARGLPISTGKIGAKRKTERMAQVERHVGRHSDATSRFAVLSGPPWRRHGEGTAYQNAGAALSNSQCGIAFLCRTKEAHLPSGRFMGSGHTGASRKYGIWRGWRGSNPRPLASEANTLSTELQPRRYGRGLQDTVFPLCRPCAPPISRSKLISLRL